MAAGKRTEQKQSCSKLTVKQAEEPAGTQEETWNVSYRQRTTFIKSSKTNQVETRER